MEKDYQNYVEINKSKQINKCKYPQTNETKCLFVFQKDRQDWEIFIHQPKEKERHDSNNYN